MINGINKNIYYISNKINANAQIKVDTSKDIKEVVNQQTKSISDDCIEVVNRIKNEVEKATLIAIKIINAENISESEEKFINIKYHNIREIAEKINKDISKLKNKMKDFNSDEERKELINREINNVKIMGKKGLISEVEVKLKLRALSDVEKFLNKMKIETKKIEVIAIKLLKNQKLTLKELALIEEKAPNLKQIINKIFKEKELLKYEIKICKTYEEKQQKISSSINKLQNLFNSNEISYLEFKLTLFYINSLENEIKKEKNKIMWINPYIYLEFSSIVTNLKWIVISIIIIAFILMFIF